MWETKKNKKKYQNMAIKKKNKKNQENVAFV